MAKASEILFRIFYSTTFTIIFIVLIAFICVSPADTLYESYRRRRLIDIFLIAGVYVVTALIAILIYASRLFTNRSVLKDIPKTYMPIEKSDLPTTRTWRFVSDMLVRSAVIAYQAKPRSTRIEHELPTASTRILDLLNPESARTQENETFKADWGSIYHRGWSSPAASDLPNLQYESVVAELIDLVEAKAVSLIPVDPLFTASSDDIPVANPRVIEALTRPDDAGMRRYISQLMDVEVVPEDDVTNAFVTLYERARFAPEPLSHTDFQSLMRTFAELLRSIKPIKADLIDLGSSSDENDDEDDKNDQPNNNTRPTPDSRSFARSSSTVSSIETNSSVIHLPPPRISEDSAPSLATDEEATQVPFDPSTSISKSSTQPVPLRTRPHRRFVSAIAGPRTLRQQRSEASLASTKSDTSRRSIRSGASAYSNGGSVIVRLNDDDMEAGALPYMIEISPLNVRVANG